MQCGPIHLSFWCPALSMNNAGQAGFFNGAIEPKPAPSKKRHYISLSLSYTHTGEILLHSILSLRIRIGLGHSAVDGIEIGALRAVDPRSYSTAMRTDVQDYPLGEWVWELDATSIHHVEDLRRTTPQGDKIHLDIMCEGTCILQRNEAPADYHSARFLGRASLFLSNDDWAKLLSVAYEMPITLSLPLSTATLDSSWHQTNEAFGHARRALASGDGKVALADCYDLLVRLGEKAKGNGQVFKRPYSTADWKDVFELLGEQSDQRMVQSKLPDKLKALTELFFALGQLGTVFGHHGAQQAPPTQPPNTQPLEHWEAEIFTAMEQLGIAYLARRVGGV